MNEHLSMGKLEVGRKISCSVGREAITSEMLSSSVSSLEITQEGLAVGGVKNPAPFFILSLFLQSVIDENDHRFSQKLRTEDGGGSDFSSTKFSQDKKFPVPASRSF